MAKKAAKPVKSRGRNLTESDKIAMHELRKKGESYADIAKVIGKGRETVKRHFDRNGDPLKEPAPQPEVVKKVTEPVVEKPKEEQVNPVKNKTVAKKPKPPKKIPFHHLTSRKDAEGKPMGTGIAVMTPAGSERADDFHKALPSSRLAKGAIFDIKQGKLKE